MPALLIRMLIGRGRCASAFLAASMSVTSSTSASAFSPRARIAAAASSISFLVRAASVTCAPAAASADAAASPMPRPPPVTSARLPSRRNERCRGEIDSHACLIEILALASSDSAATIMTANVVRTALPTQADVFVAPATRHRRARSRAASSTTHRTWTSEARPALQFDERQQNERHRHVFGEIALHADAALQARVTTGAESYLGDARAVFATRNDRLMNTSPRMAA